MVLLPEMLLGLAANLLVPAVAAAVKLPAKKVLTLEVAKAIAAAAEQHATQNKWAVVIAILDDGANLIYLERMDGTQIGSIDVAIAKAKSAALYKRPSKVFEDAVNGGNTGLLGLPALIANEGGLPISVDGEVIGSIGVSGASSQEDGMVAQAGVDALQSILGQ